MEENGLKAVRMLYVAFNHGDFDGVAAQLRSDVTLIVRDEHGNETDEGPFRGVAEVRSLFESIGDRVIRPYFDVQVETGDEGRVVTSVMVRGTLRSSQEEGAMPAVHVFSFDGAGLIREIRVHRPSWESLGTDYRVQSESISNSAAR
jgi:ketosteroid isomerase-like protein